MNNNSKQRVAAQLVSRISPAEMVVGCFKQDMELRGSHVER